MVKLLGNGRFDGPVSTNVHVSGKFGVSVRDLVALVPALGLISKIVEDDERSALCADPLDPCVPPPS
jgi:hypothetical protein